MSQLYFYYGVMSAGKSTLLLQTAHNYKERGMTPLLITANIDDRYGIGKITSRIGLDSNAQTFKSDTDLISLIRTCNRETEVNCVLIDEAQFLTRKQVEALTFVVDELKIPVICYGLRVNFKMELFSGSAALFALADKTYEMKTICHCGRKATQIAKVNELGGMVDLDSPEIEIGGNDRYVSVCRQHWHELKA